jgi:hypothetical protein
MQEVQLRLEVHTVLTQREAFERDLMQLSRRRIEINMLLLECSFLGTVSRLSIKAW